VTQKRLAIYSSLVKQKQSSPYLELVSKNLPPDVQISEIAINDNEIVITGDTANERSVQQIIVNLIATKEFAGVALQEIKSTPTSDQLFTFTIQCVVEQKGGTS
jgi:Tfp pilus assembly protein PilN